MLRYDHYVMMLLSLLLLDVFLSHDDNDDMIISYDVLRF
jgi:hypothetical protein